MLAPPRPPPGERRTKSEPAICACLGRKQNGAESSKNRCFRANDEEI